MSSELRTLLDRVSTATLSMVLFKQRGLRNVSLRGLFPLDAKRCRFAGPAYTVRYIPLREDLLPTQFMDHPQNKMTPLVEAVPAGAVLVLDANGRRDVGMLGGNIAARLQARALAGVVTDGAMRDIREIEAVGLPMFIAGSAAPPSFTQLMIADVQSSVVCGGVSILPGDWVVADADGVVAVPAAFALEAAQAACAQDELEAYVHARLRRGEALPGLYPPTAGVVAAFDQWVKQGKPEL